MARRSVTRTISSALVTYQGAILLLRRAKPYTEISFGKGTWELPGGAIDFGETPEAAVRREMREELGVAVPRRPRLQVRDTCAYVLETNTVQSHRVHLIFAVALRRIPEIRLGVEHDEYVWVDAAAGVTARLAIPELRRVVARLLRAQ